MRAFWVLVLGALLSACMHVPIQQGNVLDREKVKQLRVGMTKAEVRALLGDPVYEDRLHPRRMVYIEEKEENGRLRTRRLILRLDPSGRVAEIRREGF